MPITKSESSFQLDLTDELFFVKDENKDAVKEEIGNLLIQAIKDDTARSISPVNGNRFVGLSKAYKEIKRKKGKGSSANLRLTESLMNSLRFEPTPNGVKIIVEGEKNELKSFNHNFGDTIPQRRFLPDDSFGQSFRTGIMNKVESTVKKSQDKDLLRELRERPRPDIDITTETTGSPEFSVGTDFNVDSFLADILSELRRGR